MTITAPTLFSPEPITSPRPTERRPVAPRPIALGDHCTVPDLYTMRGGVWGGEAVGLTRGRVTIRRHGKKGETRSFPLEKVVRHAKPNELIEDFFAEKDPIIVIPCGKKKLDHAAPAGDLYIGSQHRLARQAADRLAFNNFGRVVILSAKHGLLDLDTVIEPYDLTVGDEGAVDKGYVARQLIAMDARNIIALTPKGYTDLLTGRVGIRVDARLSGDIFEQRRQLAQIKHGEWVA